MTLRSASNPLFAWSWPWSRSISIHLILAKYKHLTLWRHLSHLASAGFVVHRRRLKRRSLEGEISKPLSFSLARRRRTACCTQARHAWRRRMAVRTERQITEQERRASKVVQSLDASGFSRRHLSCITGAVTSLGSALLARSLSSFHC